MDRHGRIPPLLIILLSAIAGIPARAATPAVLDTFALSGDDNILDETHFGIVNGRATVGIPYRRLAAIDVPDVASGFRAYTREAALRMTIVSDFSYTLESIIQAGKKRMAVAHVPIRTNQRTRRSRLFDSVWTYVKASAATIVRIYAMYEPLKVFT